MGDLLKYNQSINRIGLCIIDRQQEKKIYKTLYEINYTLLSYAYIRYFFDIFNLPILFTDFNKTPSNIVSASCPFNST